MRNDTGGLIAIIRRVSFAGRRFALRGIGGYQVLVAVIPERIKDISLAAVPSP
jgi:hypothetical protein